MAKPGDVIHVLVNGNPVPTMIDEDGVQRFIANGVVVHLLDQKAIDLNLLMLDANAGKFTLQDYQMFFMAMGYDIDGFVDMFPDAKVLNPLWADD